MLSKICHKTAHARLMKVNKGLFLVASFHTSTQPTVWQFDLRKAGSVALTLRDQDDLIELVTRKPDGTCDVVVSFDDEQEAQKALRIVSNAMLQRAFFPRLGPWTRLLVAVVLVILFSLFVLRPSSEEIDQMGAQPKKTSQLVSEKQKQLEPSQLRKKIIPQGVPVNADDILIPPRD